MICFHFPLSFPRCLIRCLVVPTCQKCMQFPAVQLTLWHLSVWFCNFEAKAKKWNRLIPDVAAAELEGRKFPYGHICSLFFLCFLILNVEPISLFFYLEFNIIWVSARLLTFKLTTGWVWPIITWDDVQGVQLATKPAFAQPKKKDLGLQNADATCMNVKNFTKFDYDQISCHGLDKAGRKSCWRITFTLGLPWLPCLSLKPRSQIQLNA